MRVKKLTFFFLTARTTNQVGGDGYKHQTELGVLLEELGELESESEKTAEQQDKNKKERSRKGEEISNRIKERPLERLVGQIKMRGQGS